MNATERQLYPAVPLKKKKNKIIKKIKKSDACYLSFPNIILRGKKGLFYVLAEEKDCERKMEGFVSKRRIC